MDKSARVHNWSQSRPLSRLLGRLRLYSSQLASHGSSDISLKLSEHHKLAQTEGPKLCNYCQKILVLLQAKEPWSEEKHQQCISKGGWSLEHYNNERDLIRSAENGCCLCVQLSSTYAKSFHVIPSIPPNTESDAVFSAEADGSWKMGIRIKQNTGRTWFQVFEVIFYAILSSTPVFRPQKAPQNTKDVLPQAKIWLETCRREHSSCLLSSIGKLGFLPTRLIDLKGVDIKLVSGASLDCSTQYTTLSHCWGKESFITLKRSSIAEYFTKIPYDDLPQTFKDAVQIARYLGFYYLWIDSLCIIQDDMNDWKIESALMASVYGNSNLTIAASGAQNSSVGCFFDRKPSFRCQLETEFDNKKQLYECNPKEFGIDKILKQQPLLSRGWVVQERILSLRTLHFTTTELVWQCKTSRVSERLPMNIDYRNLPRPPFSLEVWQKLVETYSTCQLTNGGDKLVAMSGLAQASGLGARQRYCAGLWEDDIEQQLCWTVIEGSRYPSYRAPSWSWASCDGEIRGVVGDQLLIKAQKVHVQPVRTEEPYGAVQNASIRLFCTTLIFGYLPNHHHGHGFSDHEPDGYYFCYAHDNYVVNPRECFLLPLLQRPENNRLYQAREAKHLTRRFTWTFSLIVRPTGNVRGQYRRIGWIWLNLSELDSRGEEPQNFKNLQAKAEDYVEAFLDKTVDGQEFAGIIELV